MAVSDTLNERGNRYGDFMGHARYTQALKRSMQNSPNWAKMDDDQREALEMIAHKIGRILNGDPNYSDSWHDIAGYAQLVDTRLKEAGEIATAPVPATDSFRPERPAPAAPAAPKPVAPPAPAKPSVAPPSVEPVGGPVKS